MLNEKNLPNYFWAEAIATVVFIMNRTPTSIVHGMTPEEKFIGKKLDVSHLRMFGCIAYVHVPDENRSKLDPKAKKCIFIGYFLGQKDIDVSTFPLGSCKWVEMLCLMRWLVGIHH
jgi:hypothetical protein